MFFVGPELNVPIVLNILELGFLNNLSPIKRPTKKLQLSPINAAAQIVTAKIEMFRLPDPANPPARNKSESPGKNGVTTKPVSQNITKNNMA